MAEPTKNKFQKLLSFLSLGAVGENLGLMATAPTLGIASNQSNKQLDEIRKQQKALMDKIKITTNQEEKTKLLNQSRLLSGQTENVGNQISNLTNTVRNVGQISDQDLTKSNLGFALGQAGRQTAGLASYAIPFGKGTKIATKGINPLLGLLGKTANLATNTLIPGAGVGALNSLSQENVTAQDVKSGAVGGAIGAGLFKGGTELLKAGGKGLAKLGGKLVNKATANFIQTSPAVFQKAAESGINVNDVFQKYFKATDKLENLIGKVGGKGEGKVAKLLGESEGIINKTIKNYGNDVVATADDLIKPLIEQGQKLAKVPGNTQKVQQLSAFIEDVKKLYPQGTNAKQLLELKRIFDHQFGASVVDDATGAVIRDAQKSIANTARGILKNTFSTIKNALDNESELLTLRPILEKARATAETTALKQPGGLGLLDLILGVGGSAMGSPAVGLGLVAGKKALQSPTALNAMGKTAQAVGGAQLPSALSNILGKVMPQLAARTGSNLATGSVGVSPEQEQVNAVQDQQNIPNQNTPPSTNNIPLAESIDISKLPPEKQAAAKMIQEAKAAAQGGAMGGVGEITPQQAMMAQMLLSPKELTKFNNMYKIQQDTAKASQTKAPSAASQTKIELGKSGLRALDQVEDILKKDPSKALKASIPGQLGARDYDSAAFRAVEGLLRSRSGAAVPETEVRRYMRANLPRIGDTKGDIKFKLESFRKDLEAQASFGATEGADTDALLQLLGEQGINL